MARIRSVHPGLFTDEAFVSLSDAAKILFIGVWTEADDNGVFEWKPITLKMRLMPASNASVDPLLDELVALDMVKKYDHDGRKFGVVRNFGKYQRPKKPKTKYFIPNEFRTYAALSDKSSEPAPSSDEESSEPVGNPYGTGGEISPQMEDGGGSRKNKQASPEQDAARVPDRPPDAGWLRTEVAKAFDSAGSTTLPDTSRCEVWLAQGFDAKLCAAVVRDTLAKKPTLRSLNYFDGPIRDAHESRKASGGTPSPRKSQAEEDDNRWRWRIKFQWIGQRAWVQGGEPGKPDCQVPTRILREFGIEPHPDHIAAENAAAAKPEAA